MLRTGQYRLPRYGRKYRIFKVGEIREVNGMFPDISQDLGVDIVEDVRVV